jgi:serine/threonine protein phosphatase PrpC
MMVELDQLYFKQNLETNVRNQGSTSLFAVIQPPDLFACSCYPFFSSKKKSYLLHLAHLGDSRAILVRGGAKMDNNSYSVDVLTQDHRTNHPLEMERIKNAGGSVGDGRVDGKLAVTRSIGDWAFKHDPDLPVEKQKVIPVPDIIIKQLYSEDFLLIACDGVFEKLSSESVAEILMKELIKSKFQDPCAALVKLFDEAIRAGSTDNLTANLILFKSGFSYRHASPELVLGKIFFEDGLHLQYGLQFAHAFGLEAEYRKAVELEWETQNSELLSKGKKGLPPISEIWSRIEMTSEGDESMSFNSSVDFVEEKISIR